MANFHKPESKTVQELKDIANKLRIHSIEATSASKSGDPSSDRFILSKGHAAPILYAAWAEAGLFPTEDLLKLRKIDSDLEGHPTPRLNFIDVGTGSLGQGLVYCLLGDGESAEGSVWEALHFASHYKLDNLCVIIDVNRLGQSEPTSLQHDMEVYRKRLAAFGFNALVIDGHDVEELCKVRLRKSWAEAGLFPTEDLLKLRKIDSDLEGHPTPRLNFIDVGTGSLGQGLSHLQSLLKNSGPLQIHPQKPLVEDAPEVSIANIKLASPPNYKLGQSMATREAYGVALAKLAQNNTRVIALDGDTKNSTYSDKIKKNLVGVAIGAACRDRTVAFVSTFAVFLTRAFDQAFHEASITEGKPTVILAKTYKGKGFPNVEDLENWHGKPLGDKAQSTIEHLQSLLKNSGPLQIHPQKPLVEDAPEVSIANIKLASPPNYKLGQSMATREAYGVALAKLAQNNTRVIALDGDTKNSTYSDKIKKIRMGAISQTNVNFVGSHCGVSIGEDGPSQMGSTVFYPSDAVSCERAIELAANTKGVCFVLVIGAGVTVYEALTAAEELAKSNIHVRVMDLFTVKPLDAAAIIENAKECGGRIITVEDHYPEGGLGEAVLSAVAGERDIVTKMLAVREIPRSGPPNALLEKYGISAKSIVVAVKEIIKV
ncbi:hypothetical protein B566_EDAN016229 [Ephemera danica]|nr:hypothetical protein B566_EDAN016229 [Ephemera danica]